MKRIIMMVIAAVTIGVMATAARSQDAVSFRIGWGAAADPNAASVLLYRATVDADASYAAIATLTPQDTEYIDEDPYLDAGIRYYYRLRSRSSTGILSAFTSAVSGIYIDESSPLSLKSQCAIDSVVAEAGGWRVYWSTSYLSTGRIRYWRMGETTYNASSRESTSTLHHSVLLTGLEADQIYFLKAAAYSGAGVMVSCAFAFTTGTGGPSDFTFAPSSSAVSIPEGGTATFGLRLSAEPSDDVTASVMMQSGDADITVQSGSSLVFTPANWSEYQTVTLAAAADADVANGAATVFIFVAAGPQAPIANVTASEIDDDRLYFVTTTDTLTVGETESEDVGVRLSQQPPGTVQVTVARASGGDNIVVDAGASLSFTTANWSSFQTVSIASLHDVDSNDDAAAIRIHAASGAVIRDTLLYVFDNDDEPVDTTGGGNLAAAPVLVYPMPYRPEEGVLNLANLPSAGSIDLYDLVGRKVWETEWEGETTITWNGKNSCATAVASGRYFIVVKDGAGRIFEKRAILVVR